MDLDIALKNSTPVKIANTGKRAVRFETARIHFLGDVFAAFASVVAKAP